MRGWPAESSAARRTCTAPARDRRDASSRSCAASASATPCSSSTASTASTTGAPWRRTLREVLAPMPGATFRDRYVDLDFDLSEALFVATANRLGPVPAVLRDDMTVVEVPGYTEAEKRDIAAGHLLPFQLARHGLTAGRVRVTGDAVDAVVRGYTREAGVWGLADCAGHGLRQGGAPAGRGGRDRRSRSRPGGARPRCWARRRRPRRSWPAAPGDRAWRSDCAGRPPAETCSSSRPAACPVPAGWSSPAAWEEAMQESAHVALSWLRANAEHYSIDPGFPRDTDVAPARAVRRGAQGRAPRPASRWWPPWCPPAPGAPSAPAWP